MNELILELADTLGVTAETIVGHYVRWFIISATTWIILAISSVWLAYSARLKTFIYEGFDGRFDEPHLWLLWIRIVITFFAVLILGFNIPDLLAPRGISIHQLLIDLPG